MPRDKIKIKTLFELKSIPKAIWEISEVNNNNIEDTFMGYQKGITSRHNFTFSP